MSWKPSRARPLYHRVTEGIRITVKPRYLSDQSEPEAAHYLFAYRIRLENVGTRPAQLLTRHWLITNQNGEEVEVEGAGVVGQNPYLPAGGVYEYESFCAISLPRGWMEGSYQFIRPDGSTFQALVPRFDLEP